MNPVSGSINLRVNDLSWREVEGQLAELPSERADDLPGDHPADELSARRRARKTS